MVEFYPYAYVRTIVMRSRLLSRNDYDTLLKMRPNEIINYLQSKGYKEFSKYGTEYKGIELVERSIKENMTKDFNKLRRISTEDMRELIDTYLIRYDLRNIKTIVRGMMLKQDTTSLVIPAGMFSLEFYRRMFNTNDVKKALSMLKGTIFEKAIGKSLPEIEMSLDRLYYNFLLSSNPKNESLNKFIKEEVLVKNILTFLKLKKNNISNILLPGNFKIIRKLMKNDSLEPLKSYFGKYIKDGIEVYKKTGSLVELEKELRIYLLKKLRIFSHQNLLSIDTILSFMFEKDIEIKNILLIYKAKMFNMDDEIIKNNIII